MMPVPAAFRTFYIVADGPDANFQTYADELTAKYFGLAFSVLQNKAPADSRGSVYFVSAPGWNQDTLTTACSKDKNVVGGLVIKFASYYTDAYWILYNAETQHVTPSLVYISCWQGIAIMAAPTISIHTQKSGPQVTVPIGPISGLATLFGPPAASGNQPAWQVGVGTFAVATSLGAFNGNVGVYNPGHEALGVANRISLQAVVVTQAVCNFPNTVPPLPLPGPLKLDEAVTQARLQLDPGSATDASMFPQLRDIQAFEASEDATFPHLDETAWPWPTPQPQQQPQAQQPSVSVLVTQMPTPRPTVPTPAPSPIPSPYPLRAMCAALSPPTPTPTSPPSTPSPEGQPTDSSL
jgi:hypothetical protein